MPVPRWSAIKDNSIEAYRGISSFHAMIPPIRDEIISALWNSGCEVTATTCHLIPAGKSIFPEACLCTAGLCGESPITCTCFESYVWKSLPRLVSRSFSLILSVRSFLCSCTFVGGHQSHLTLFWAFCSVPFTSTWLLPSCFICNGGKTHQEVWSESVLPSAMIPFRNCLGHLNLLVAVNFMIYFYVSVLAILKYFFL